MTALFGFGDDGVEQVFHYESGGMIAVQLRQALERFEDHV
jgi:hypothetical protein